MANDLGEEQTPSLFRGPPLEAQPGLGALTLPGYFADICSRFAGREALVFFREDGSVLRWSYAQLHEEAMLVARAISATGHAKGACIAVLMTNRPEWLASVFGILMAGCVAAPLSTFATPDELGELLSMSNAATLLFEATVLNKDFRAILAQLEPAIDVAGGGVLLSPRFPFLHRLVAVGGGAAGMVERWEDFLARGEAVPADLVAARGARVTPFDPAMLYFSSGSTGHPKGILNAQRGVAVQMWRWPRQMGLPNDGSVRGWGANGFFWSGGFAQAVGAIFTCGGTLVLQPTFDPVVALDLIERERINYLTCWPHQYARMAEAPNYATADLGSLHYISRGTAFEDHPTVSTDWTEPLASYGSTETFTFNCGYANDAPAEEVRGSHGRAFPGTILKVVDPLSGEILPVGQSGEIAVKGATLMLGYIGVPPEETFDEEGFFRTGDGGHCDAEGRLYFEGRLGDIIKTGGANVSPLEIDAVLVEIEGVKVCQTVGVPHATLGEMIVSCVVPLAGHVLDEAGLRDRLKARLASYKVPRRILLCREEELNLTGSAKVRTAASRELAALLLEQERWR